MRSVGLKRHPRVSVVMNARLLRHLGLTRHPHSLAYEYEYVVISRGNALNQLNHT